MERADSPEEGQMLGQHGNAQQQRPLHARNWSDKRLNEELGHETGVQPVQMNVSQWRTSKSCPLKSKRAERHATHSGALAANAPEERLVPDELCAPDLRLRDDAIFGEWVKLDALVNCLLVEPWARTNGVHFRDATQSSFGASQ